MNISRFIRKIVFRFVLFRGRARKAGNKELDDGFTEIEFSNVFQYFARELSINRQSVFHHVHWKTRTNSPVNFFL